MIRPRGRAGLRDDDGRLGQIVAGAWKTEAQELTHRVLPDSLKAQTRRTMAEPDPERTPAP